MKKIGTLRRAFFIVILPVIAVLTSLLFLVTQRLEMIEQYDFLQEDLERLLQEQENQFSYPLWIVNNERIESMAERFVESPDVVGISIYDDRDRLISSRGIMGGYTREAMDFAMSDNLAFKKGIPQLIEILLDSVMLTDRAPQYLTGYKKLYFPTDSVQVPVGMIYITLSDEDMVESLKEHIRILFTSLALTYFLMSISISQAYYYTVQIPLTDIKKSLIEKEKSGILPQGNRSQYNGDELAFIKMRFEKLWNLQDELLKDQYDSKEYYRTLLNSLPIGIVLLAEDGGIIESNTNFCHITGFSEKDFQKLSLQNITAEEKKEYVLDRLAILNREGDVAPFVINVMTKKGDLIPFRINGSLVRRGFEKKLLLSLENISEKLAIETELEQSNSFLNTTSEMAKVGGWELKPRSQELSWTREIYRIYEIAEGTVPNFDLFISPIQSDYLPVIQLSIRKAVESGIPFKVESKINTGTGKEKWIEIKGKPVFTSGAIEGINGTIQDISERKRHEKEFFALQRELNHKSRLDLIGQLASGVAHDFNNILNGILSAADLLRIKMGKKSEELGKYIDIIISQSESAAMLSSRLLAFSRKEKYIKKITDLNSLLEDTVTILKNTLDKKISISLYQEGEAKIFADFSSIQNAIMNVCINSSHAMPDGGNLSISTEVAERGRSDFVKVTISDTGSGIKKENIDRIFEPFFTTKKKGEGTGLGLSAVKRAIEEHDGEISIKSVEGIGTTLEIHLPTEKNDSPESAAELNIIPGRGTILLVDDEDANRFTGKEILESMGYQVLLASNGLEAVERFEEKRDAIDLIILDMVMPIMDGSEAFYRIKEIDLAAKVVILTGYAENEKLSLMKEIGVEAIMMKPFKASELSKVIFEILK